MHTHIKRYFLNNTTTQTATSPVGSGCEKVFLSTHQPCKVLAVLTPYPPPTTPSSRNVTTANPISKAAKEGGGNKGVRTIQGRVALETPSLEEEHFFGAKKTTCHVLLVILLSRQERARALQSPSTSDSKSWGKGMQPSKGGRRSVYV